MQGFTKVVLIIVAFLIGGVLLAILKEIRGGSGYGPLGSVIVLVFLVGIRAIWNYSPEKQKEDTTDIDKLDKN